MFLPDGKALIMDSELYRQTIENSIIIDLVDGYSPSELPQLTSAESTDSNIPTRNAGKEINRKPSQAN
jgi:hypothetical protein